MRPGNGIAIDREHELVTGRTDLVIDIQFPCPAGSGTVAAEPFAHPSSEPRRDFMKPARHNRTRRPSSRRAAAERMCLPRRLAHDARLAIQQQAADFAGGQSDLFGGPRRSSVSGTDRRGSALRFRLYARYTGDALGVI